MDMTPMQNLALFDLIARAWPCAAPAESAAFNRRDTAAAFVLADGSIAIAGMSDPENPATRTRVAADTGRVTIAPRKKPPAALVAPEARVSGPAAFAPHGETTFAAGGADGAVRLITPRGQAVKVGPRLPGPVAALASDGARDRLAAACRTAIIVFTQDADEEPLILTAPSDVKALAFDSTGDRLAAATGSGISRWRLDDPAAAPVSIGVDPAPGGLAWSPDGAWIACPGAARGFALVDTARDASHLVGGYPDPVRSVTWSTPARAIATGGAFRAVAWLRDALPVGGDASGALVTGRPGLVVVESVAAHPIRPLLAIGYASGLVTIARFGSPDEMLLRADGDGGAQALAWSGSGDALAIGHAGGSVAVAQFPPGFFK